MKARAILERDSPGCGACDIDVPPGPDGADRLLVALVAGSEAEGRLLGQPRSWHASTDDAKTMLRLIGGLTRPASVERLARAKRSAAQLLRDRRVWTATQEVAARLTRAQVIDDASVREAVVAAGLTLAV